MRQHRSEMPCGWRNVNCNKIQGPALEFARAVVGARIHNTRMVLMKTTYPSRRHILASLAQRITELEHKQDRAALRGVEGAATKAIYSAIRELVAPGFISQHARSVRRAIRSVPCYPSATRCFTCTSPAHC